MPRKIKLLFLASDPRDVLYRPTLDEEFRQIKKSLQASKYGKLVQLECEMAVQPTDLQELLSRHEPEIVHYSGHANSKGLVMQNRVGRRTLVSKRMLSELFKANPGVRLVVLNACYSAAQIEAIAETVDFTIGMKDLAIDKNAVTFAATLYGELASGHSVSKAFKGAKVGITLQKAPRSKMPELRTREDADASFSFFAQRSSRLPKKAPKPTSSKPRGATISAGRDIKKNTAIIIGDKAKVNA